MHPETSAGRAPSRVDPFLLMTYDPHLLQILIHFRFLLRLEEKLASRIVLVVRNVDRSA